MCNFVLILNRTYPISQFFIDTFQQKALIMKRADCQLAKPFAVFDLFGERKVEKPKGVSRAALSCHGTECTH